ncbi:MAG: class I SAM-dependent methyltransferase [Bacteroidetes bacterium]|nr:class I SAM-dependent methyltransferase [Bacteroidota bacterium]
MLAEEIQKISSDDVQNFIFCNETADEKKILLRQKSIHNLPAQLIAQQIAGRKKAKVKLPLFYKTKGIVYPPQLNLEQSSSEATALFKTTIIQQEFGEREIYGADLTGGFGIDSFFLSWVTKSVNHVDLNHELITVVKHNHLELGVKNVFYNPCSAEDFLKEKKIFDFFYLDPSRRNAQNKKTFRLTEHNPDVLTLLPQLFNLTDIVLLKTSPLLDIWQGLRELVFVKKVFVVSVDNECKELLFLLRKGFTVQPSIETVNLENNGQVKHFFKFTQAEEVNSDSDFGEPQAYLYEPNASILKAGAFKLIGKRFGLFKLHPSTHLYTSNVLVENFPGRIFQILNPKFDLKNIDGRKANIITRNYPLKPEVLKKKFKLTDGGENYLLAFSGQQKKFTVHAKRLA